MHKWMGVNFSSPIRVKEATANCREDMFAKVRPLVNARKQSGWLCGWTGRTAQEDDTRTSDELRSRAAVVITSAWYPASLIGPWVHPVASVPPFWFFSLSLFLSPFTREQTRVHTRKCRSVRVVSSAYFSFRVCCCPPSLSLFLSFSRYPAGSRRAQMRLSRQRAVVGTWDEFPFSSSLSSYVRPIFLPFVVFLLTSRQLHSTAAGPRCFVIHSSSSLCSPIILLGIVKLVQQHEETEVYRICI